MVMQQTLKLATTVKNIVLEQTRTVTKKRFFPGCHGRIVTEKEQF
jgi:hypothetical protein